MRVREKEVGRREKDEKCQTRRKAEKSILSTQYYDSVHQSSTRDGGYRLREEGGGVDRKFSYKKAKGGEADGVPLELSPPGLGEARSIVSGRWISAKKVRQERGGRAGESVVPSDKGRGKRE